ncbi:hypothetical protein UCDDA912_g03576 [Diaporthe ampelina]|uniref:Uncharacterized protein n=1 Tax=Diaporthe ampelina TaxID=1214573 RepID=A0A0G2HNC4_9PEZI|nr:hypothetical protein UCDDA912_g03576 [Diaporthe ampelina]
MRNLELYLGHLILRELEQFRASAAVPAKHNATEVAQHECPPQSATGQDSTTAKTAKPDTAATDGEGGRRPAAAEPPQGITALVEADEAANGFQGTPVRLLALRGATGPQRRNNAARQQRVYRLAHKIGVSPGGARWVRGGRPHAQPAVPRCAARADGTVEYNQFVHAADDGGRAVALRMPGGWKRDLVRDRDAFLGVALIDGFLWPRFESRLPRRILVDWEEQGFVEFNEVRYTTPFVAREPRAAAAPLDTDQDDGALIKLGD